MVRKHSYARRDGLPPVSWGGFLASVRDRPEVLNAAMGEEKPSDGGFLVPEQLREQVYAYLEGSIVRSRAMILPMDSWRLGVPALDNYTQSSDGAALGGVKFELVREGHAIPSSAASLQRVVLEARKFAALVEGVPAELVEDAGPAWEQFISTIVGRGYAWSEDHLFLRGSGVGEPEGLLNASCAVTVTRAASGSVTLADVAAMRARVAPASLENRTAVWVCSPAVVTRLGELNVQAAGVDGSSNATEVPVPPTSGMGLSADRRGWRLAGLRLLESSHMPDLGTEGDLCVADFSCYAIGDRRQFTVERSQLGPTFFEDTWDFRLSARVDGRWLVRSPISPPNGAETVSPVVVLN